VSAVTDPAGFDAGLRGLLDDFAELYGALLHDPAWVRDQCRELSEQFARGCDVRGIPAEVVSGLRFGEDPHFPGERVVTGGHFAVQVPTRRDAAGAWGSPVVVDWSARQFDPVAPVPELTAPETWRQTWR
jgi:hypothetical protein